TRCDASAPPAVSRQPARSGGHDRGEGAREDRPLRGDRRKERRAVLLGAAPSARRAGFPPPARVRDGARVKFGIERLLEDHALRSRLGGKRVALLAHPASVTRTLAHSLDALAALRD